MSRLQLLAVALFVAVPTGLAAAAPTLPGSWRKLPPAPLAVQQNQTAVWTGSRLIVFGRNPARRRLADVAETFDPAANTWRRLLPPPGPIYSPGYKSIWTGREMLVFGAVHAVAFDPAMRRWRPLPTLHGGSLVWTGSEAIGWGGGCCGDASADGDAYNPATRTFRPLPRSPLAPSQDPLGVWTGREVIQLVSGFDPEGKPSPRRYARAAAYDPATNVWRRIAPLPAAGPRFMGTAVWDGSELLVAAAGPPARSTFAYNPATNAWRRLAPLPAGRVGATAIWTGSRLVLWGGQNVGTTTVLRNGLAYDPRTNRWERLPQAPFRARSGSVVAWTGRSLLVWGGEAGTPVGRRLPPRFPRDGAAFTPTS